MAPGQACGQNLGPATQIRDPLVYSVILYHFGIQILKVFFPNQKFWAWLEAGVDVFGCKALCLEDVMDIWQVALEEKQEKVLLCSE